MQIPTYNLRRQAQQGQTIVIALLVLLLLGFIGGLFASIVTGSLRSAARSNRVQTADYYAESGIRFADDQLTHNPDGADWRPPLQFQITDPNFQPKDSLGSARYMQLVKQVPPVLALPDTNDPDLPFLKQGFARYNIGTGRFLLRLTYDPVGVNTSGGTAVADPNARYIKIESVGREGLVDPNDPTTFQNKPAIRLAATLVEYKAIGLTDYARFETNPDKRSDIMALGVASQQYVADFDPAKATLANPFNSVGQFDLITTYGAPDAYTVAVPNQYLVPTLAPNAGSNLATTATTQPGGGGIHVNGSARFYGLNYVYLNHTGGITGNYNEGLEVAGDLLLDNYGASATDVGAPGRVKIVTSFPVPQPPLPAPQPPAPGGPYQPVDVLPSNASQVAGNVFNTLGGAVRDGGNGTDASGNPRNANRLEPPVLETANPATNLPRYLDLATHSVPRQADTVYPAFSVANANAAQYGYGQAIYVDNGSDVQSDSTALVGGYTLEDEWLHRAPQGLGRSGWSASYYRPPGVEIVLGRQAFTDKNNVGHSFYGVRLTRSDVDESGKPVLWKDPTDITKTVGATMLVSYTSMNASHLLDPTNLAGTDLTAYQANPNNDVVIYAEGNVRVRGTVSAFVGAQKTDETLAMDQYPRHVTIVTNGTAYIEGSLLRGNPESSISVLAHDYVCINTTQFLAGAQTEDNPIGTRPPGPYSGDPYLHALDFSASDEVLLQEFQYVPASTIGTGAQGAATLALYVSAGPSAPGDASADFDMVNTATGVSIFNPPSTLFQTPFQPPPFTSSGTGGNGMTHTTFPLNLYTLTQNDLLAFAVRRTPSPLETIGGVTSPVVTATQDLLLERAAILPADIHIEAVLFAQTRSFFVIPGDWFNTVTDDNLANYIAQNVLPAVATRPGISQTNNDQHRYPFFGQPIDMKIIITGSVSEARPADIAAQTAWMEKWGWIPQYHGTYFVAGSAEPANRNSPLNPSLTQVRAPGIGLTLLYNPQAGYPYAPAASRYLRTDIYGRPLPYTPSLPVCTGLLYSGQNSADQPVLQ